MAVSSVSNQANVYGSMYTSQKQDKDVSVRNENSANQDTADVGKYLEELKKKNPKLNINSGGLNTNMKSGNYPNKFNVSIAPNILQQMATDPEAASKYERILSNIPKLEQWARGMTRAITGGNEVLYSCVWIDENGGMGRFSVSGPSKAQKMADAKRHEDAKKAFEERLEKARKKRKELEEWIAGQREKMPVADEDWMDIRKIDIDAIEAGNKWQIPAVEDLNENGNMRTFEAGNILTEEGQYALKCGAVVNSKYGYASQLDMVSRDYEKALFNHDYSAAASQDVISDMNEKYKQLKEEIENNYSGAEKEDRLKELNANYDEIVNYNIIRPLQHNIQFEITANKLRQKIGSFYDKAKATEGTAEADKRYAGMSDWKAATDELGTTLDNMKALFDELLKTIKNSKDNDEAGKYADSILKSINSGMAGIEEKKNTFRGTLDDAQNDKLKELWDLIEQKTGIYQDYNKKYFSDEEKYRSFLKESSKFSGIDNRIDELLKEITGA